MKVLLGVSGSVACKLTSKLRSELFTHDHEVETVVTQSVLNFIEDSPYYHKDEDEYKKKDSVLHIDLVTWADRFIVAPCTANTLAKISAGFADNLLTNCVRAWDYKKPLVIAPAMNTQMWNHPITKEQIWKMQSWGARIVQPQSKLLVCGVEGIGAMAQIDDILNS